MGRFWLFLDQNEAFWARFLDFLFRPGIFFSGSILILMTKMSSKSIDFDHFWHQIEAEIDFVFRLQNEVETIMISRNDEQFWMKNNWLTLHVWLCHEIGKNTNFRNGQRHFNGKNEVKIDQKWTHFRPFCGPNWTTIWWHLWSNFTSNWCDIVTKLVWNHIKLVWYHITKVVMTHNKDVLWSHIGLVVWNTSKHMFSCETHL